MRVLMVCLGNICRSPLAQGILEREVAQRGLAWHVDSAGTSAWHIGQPPDRRSVEIAALNGIDITGQRARQVLKEDLINFDLILAMDQSNYRDLVDLDLDKVHSHKIKLILNFVMPDRNAAVPDPYYNGNFSDVYRLLDEAAKSLMDLYT